MFTLNKRFAVRTFAVITLIALVAGIGLLVGIPQNAQAADGAPPGFRLPFKGYAVISQGPRCPYPGSHWSGIDHEAIDYIVYSSGAPVLATSGGWAQAFPNSWPGGNMVKVYHPNGLTSIYAHLRDFTGMNTNGIFWVNKGQRIGTVGNTGKTTGTHLHFAVVRTSDQHPVKIYNIPGMYWKWRPNNYPFAANSTCTFDGTYDGEAYGP